MDKGQIVEYAVIISIVVGFLLGLIKGFIRIFFSWFSILFGGLIAINFSGTVTKFVLPQEANNVLVLFLVGTAIFIVIYAILSRFAWAFSDSLQKLHIGAVDYLLGGIFGAAQALLISGAVCYWIMNMGWIDLSSQPVTMFSIYWADRILILFKDHLPVVKRMLNF